MSIPKNHVFLIVLFSTDEVRSELACFTLQVDLLGRNGVKLMCQSHNLSHAVYDLPYGEIRGELMYSSFQFSSKGVLENINLSLIESKLGLSLVLN